MKIFMHLTILGVPQPKQSARFRSIKAGDKTFIQSYQTKEVKDEERNIKYDIKSQLPEGFVPYGKGVALGVRVSFIFPPTSEFTKGKLKLLEEGNTFFKPKKPDLTDNLMKGLFDAMSGVVFIDDAQICKVESEKKFGMTPRTEIEVYEL